MNQNINLGTFSFDSSKLEYQIAANAQQIKKLADENKNLTETLKNTKKAIDEVEDKIEAQHKIQARLNKEKKEGTISEQRYQEEMKKSSDRLNDLLSEQINYVNQQTKTILETERNKNAIKDLREENNQLHKLYSAGRTELNDNETAYRDLNKELNALKIESKNLGAQLVQLQRDGKENTEEYHQLKEKWREVSAQADQLNDDFKALDKAVGDNQRSVGDYKDQIVEASQEIFSGFNQLANGDIAGGLQQITINIHETRSAFTSLATSMLANPLTAILVGITAVATGIGLAVKEFFDYNNQVIKLNREIQSLTNHTGLVADEIRLNATAIAETYGKDFTEAVKEINSLMADFGISAKEAFDIYNKGLAEGGATNDEFGDSIREYGVLMAQNGYNAQEFVNLLNAGIDLDIYTDKLPDAIKEAGLSLTENTKATRDALTNAFGEPFSQDILKRVEMGQTSVKDALVEISQKAKESNITLQQQAQLTADVFRGAGEDAGGALKIFEAINLAHQKETQELQGLAKHTAELTLLQKDLAQAKDNALKSDAIQSFSQSLEKFWINAQIIWYNFIERITDAIKNFNNITKSSQLLAETWEAVKDIATALWKGIEGIVGIFTDLLSLLGANTTEAENFAKTVMRTLNPLNLIKTAIVGISSVLKAFTSAIETARQKVYTFGITAKNIISQIIQVASAVKNLDFSTALDKLKNISISKELANATKQAKALNKETAKIGTTATPTKTPAQGDGRTLYDREADAKAQADADKKAEAERKKAQSKAEADRKKAIADKQKEMEQEAKRTIDLQKQSAQQSIDNAKLELAEYIRINAEKYKDDKRWTAERLKAQTEYYNEVKRQQLEAVALEEQAKQNEVNIRLKEIQEKIDAGKRLTANDIEERRLLNQQKQIIEREYQGKRAEINSETNEKIRNDEKALAEQKLEDEKLARSIAFQQKILDLEEQGASEFELKRQQALMDAETELAELNEKLENQLISIENFEAQKNLIEEQHAKASEKITELEAETRTKMFGDMFGGIAKLLGEHTAAGKAAGIAQATINTFQGVSEVWKSPSVLPEPFGTIQKAVSTGVVMASGLGAVQKIAAVQTPKAQKGMLIQGKSHAQGGVPISTPSGMIEAEGGEVIINKVSSQLFRGLLSDINVAGGGVKFAKGGVVGSQLASVQKNFNQSKGLMIESEAITQIANAIYSGSQRGLTDLSENRKIAQGANF